MKLDLHIRFNPQNERHCQIADYMESVRSKYRTALFTAAVEAYIRQHPHGPDYRELEEIRKASYSSFQPKNPIQVNLQRKRQESLPEELEKSPVVTVTAPDSMDRVIDLYALDDEE